MVESAPAVQSVIPDGHVQITGDYTMDEAKALQTVLQSGSLPVSFEYAQSQVVGPTLGQDALGLRRCGGPHRHRRGRCSTC